MKKYILGAVIGFCLSLGVSVNAEEVKTLIGKAIQGEFPVKVDGELLSNKAIVVDGTSYLPVRSFGESVGYEVLFNPEGEIILNSTQEKTVTGVQVFEEPDPIDPNATTETGIKLYMVQTLGGINAEIRRISLQIFALESGLDDHEQSGQLERVENEKEQIETFKAQLAELQELKSQKEVELAAESGTSE